MAETLPGGKAAIGAVLAVLCATWVHAADVPIPGKVTVIKAGKFAKFISKNKPIYPSTFPLAVSGSVEDPTVWGAELRIFDTSIFGAGAVTFGLDRSGWKGLGNPAGSASLRYCAEFGGQEKKNDTKLMKRKDATVPGECPEVRIAPGGPCRMPRQGIAELTAG